MQIFAHLFWQYDFADEPWANCFWLVSVQSDPIKQIEDIQLLKGETQTHPQPPALAGQHIYVCVTAPGGWKQILQINSSIPPLPKGKFTLCYLVPAKGPPFFSRRGNQSFGREKPSLFDCSHTCAHTHTRATPFFVTLTHRHTNAHSYIGSHPFHFLLLSVQLYI